MTDVRWINEWGTVKSLDDIISLTFVFSQYKWSPVGVEMVLCPLRTCRTCDSWTEDNLLCGELSPSTAGDYHTITHFRYRKKWLLCLWKGCAQLTTNSKNCRPDESHPWQPFCARSDSPDLPVIPMEAGPFYLLGYAYAQRSSCHRGRLLKQISAKSMASGRTCPQQPQPLNPVRVGGPIKSGTLPVILMLVSLCLPANMLKVCRSK